MSSNRSGFKSLSDRMNEIGKPTTGFDYLRLILAILILGWHSLLVTHGLAWAGTAMLQPAGVIIRVALPMFFALSGFLVAGSLDRNPSIPQFVMFRVLRIVPALAVEISLSAIFIGALVTSLAITSYYSSSGFMLYFLNIVGWIHFNLPGVFVGQYDDTVNRSLWTIPSELECYLFLVIFALLGLYRNRNRGLLAIIAIYAGYTMFRIIRDGSTPGFQPHAGLVLSRLLIFYFMCGVIFSRFRDKIPYNFTLFLASVIISWLTVAVEALVWLSIPAVVYMTAYLGLLNPKKPWIFSRGDYSYGVYLYAYPIQQAIVYIMPQSPWYANLAIALPTTFLFAVCSWHLIEKPALRMKNLFGRRLTQERVAIV